MSWTDYPMAVVDPFNMTGYSGKAPFNTRSTPVAGSQELGDALKAASLGQGPSAAQAQMKQGIDQGTAAQYALAQSAHGMSPAAAQRQASIGAGNVAAQSAGMGAMARANEINQARQQYAQYLQQQQTQQDKNANANLALLNNAQQGASMAFMSDRREKTAIHGGDNQAEALLDALHAYQYQYKDSRQPGASPGEHLGVMAQDVERAPAGREMVHEGPTGAKQIDTNQAVGAILAALANLHGRVKTMEGR